MTASTTGVGRLLTALDVLYPGPGDAIRVLEGQVLVFAHDAGGRRIPMATRSAGEVVVGCAPIEGGYRLLITGLPGTRVLPRTLSEEMDAGRLAAWARTLGESVAQRRWPAHVIPVSHAASMLAPGEHIASAIQPDSPVTWVRVTSGSATLCGAPGASIGPLDPTIPLARGYWLTAGLRCGIKEAPSPTTPEEWSRSLDLMGRLALTAHVERRLETDRAAAQRLEARAAQSSAAAHESVDMLAASVGGKARIVALVDEVRIAEIAAAVIVAKANGLQVSDDGMLAATGEVESGREPIAAVAAACGARARSITLEPGWSHREGSALIGSRSAGSGASNQPVALVFRRGWVWIDPLTDEETAVTDAIAEEIDRQAVELLPVLPGRPATLGDLGRLALRGSSRDVAVIAVVSVLVAALAFISPFLLGQLATLFTSNATTSAYVALFGALLAVVLVGTMWQAVRSFALLRVRSRGVAIAAGAMWERLIRQRAAWHADQPLGQRMAQASAVDGASASMPDETVTRLLDTLIIIGSLAAIATTNVQLLVGIALLLAVQVVITAILLRMSTKRAAERIDANAVAAGRLVEILKAMNRIRVAGAESRAFLRWAQVQARFSRADQSLRRVTMAQGVVIAVWPILALAVIVLVTGMTGATFGDFITAQAAASAATGAVAAAALAANASLVARETIRKAKPVLDSSPEGSVDGAQPGLISGGIEGRDIVFRYAPELPPVLDRVNISVAPGEHVAIVGPSGCGKTTLMRILLGLEDPESGVIAVDGRDLASLNRPAVRRQIGSVLQSSMLLPGELRNNIDMGRGLTTTQVWEALDAASLGDDVRAMPMGLNTPVTDGGGTLSGGQQQRVLIARAMAGNPRILVLDEATSALDNITQATVVETLNSLRITRIVVAHRLSTIRHADRIIVLDAGRVVDDGTYDELMAKPGAFRELALRQQT
jgi:ABC-type bacteriocin/lantibiotic exporter with double-glycine peptidase domain